MSLPWFPFHIKDYLASTMGLTTAGHGAMVSFLIHYWEFDCLPESDGEKIALAQIDPAEWPFIKECLTRPTKSTTTFLWTEGWRNPAMDAAKAMTAGWVQRKVSRYQQPDARRPAPEDWVIIRARIFQRDDYTCQYCGVRGGPLECDHKIPIVQGGTNDDDNLNTACLPCNRSKGPRTIEQWRAAA